MKVLAILCSDLHLTLNPPLARSEESDWLVAQQRPLDEVRDLADLYHAPVFCAGDVFDRWNSPPELINWAIDHLPKMYSIPGQHDLPFHNLDLIHRSAYWTLAETDRLLDAVKYGGRIGWGILLGGFPWGVAPSPPTSTIADGLLKVALCHQYVWVPGCSYPGAPAESHINRVDLKGWDVVVFGDNHKGFVTKSRDGKTTVFNPGSLMRRKSDELNYKPQVGLLMEDGTVEPYFLDTREDVIEAKADERPVAEDLDLEAFLQELGALQNDPLDFVSVMKQALENQRPGEDVKRAILEAMEEK